MAFPPEPPRVDEGRHHRETMASVRLKAQRLRRSLDADRLHDAIKIAADVAAELRSPSAAELSPKAYYDVYLAVCAELRLLEMYVMESARRGAPVLELYERVQETPLVLPRLYLLITAGSVYVKSMQAPAKDVLRDLVAMCAGVQHPQRGLFLRAYLAQMMKDKLPDIGITDIDDDPYDASGGTVQDSIDFVIRNFSEMNDLWVRMQNDATARDMELREKERLELRLLVGSNIATLSRLVGSNLTIYRDNVLPAIIEQIVSCGDAIAQEYLADCVAQVFPDEFQLATLDAFMQMCGKLVKGVNMRTILVSIIDRLTRFVGSSTEAKNAARDANAFRVFREELPGVVRRQGLGLVLTDRLRMYMSLMKFALDGEPDRTDYVDDVLGFCVGDIRWFLDGESEGKEARRVSSRRPETRKRKLLSEEDERLTMLVLTKPVERFQSVGNVLKLENFVVLQQCLRYENQKSLAARVLRSNSGYAPCIGDVGTLKKLFQYVASLVQDRIASEEDRENGEEEGEDRDEGFERLDPDSLSHHHEYLLAALPVSHSATRLQDLERVSRERNASGEDDVEESEDGRDGDVRDFDEREQELVARIVYLCNDEDTEQAIELYRALRQELIRGNRQRRAVTLPSLMFACLRLALRASEERKDKKGDDKETKAEELVMFAGEIVDDIGSEHAQLCLRLGLHIATTASELGSGAERHVYDNVCAALVEYEEHITNARDQHTALSLIIGQLSISRGSLSASSFLALSQRVAKHARSALTRSDQCAQLCALAQMWTCTHPDETATTSAVAQVNDCLRGALSAARNTVAAAERALLLADVAFVAIRAHSRHAAHGAGEGRTAAPADGCAESNDDALDVIRGAIEGISTCVRGRRVRASAVGRIVVSRLHAILARVRALRLAGVHVEMAV